MSEQTKDLPKNQRFNLFEVVQPLFARVLIYVILIYIAYDGYLLFNFDQQTYTELISLLNSPIIIDVVEVDWYKECPSNYKEMNATLMPGTVEGCACDNIVYMKNVCIKLFASKDAFLTSCKTTNSRRLSALEEIFSEKVYESNLRQTYNIITNTTGNSNS